MLESNFLRSIHWINSSARTSSDCGIVRPRVLAQALRWHDLGRGRFMELFPQPSWRP